MKQKLEIMSKKKCAISNAAIATKQNLNELKVEIEQVRNENKRLHDLVKEIILENHKTNVTHESYLIK